MFLYSYSVILITFLNGNNLQIALKFGKYKTVLHPYKNLFHAIRSAIRNKIKIYISILVFTHLQFGTVKELCYHIQETNEFTIFLSCLNFCHGK